MNKMSIKKENGMKLKRTFISGTYILKLPDEVLQMLEDHIVNTQQLSFSPFKGLFEQKIDDWEAKLRLVFDVLDQWIESQK